jgi:hypothetical protein
MGCEKLPAKDVRATSIVMRLNVVHSHISKKEARYCAQHSSDALTLRFPECAGASLECCTQYFFWARVHIHHKKKKKCP